MRQFGIFLVCVGLGLGAVACSQGGGSAFQVSSQSATLIAEAQAAPTPAAALSYRLQAVQALMQDQNYNAARQLMGQISLSSLFGVDRYQYVLYSATLSLIEDQPKPAIDVLLRFHGISTYPASQQIAYDQLMSQALLRSDQATRSVVFDIAQTPLLTGADQAANLTEVWHTLQGFTEAQLTRMLYFNATNPVVIAWVHLALLNQVNNQSNSAFLQALSDWQAANPNHPATALIPQDLTALKTATAPQTVALLLPLSGQYAAMGSAIRDGFMLNYYQNHSTAQLKFYDTATADVASLYQQALSDGAAVVVGPVLKDDVQTLVSKGNFPVPTVLLNYTDRPPASPDAMEFGLSPAQEAEQTASLAWQHSASRVLVIVPQGDWGASMAQYFTSSFQALGGQVVETLAYRPDQLNAQIASLLEVDQSMARINAWSAAFGEKLQAQPRRRADFDGIFLATTPEAARQILPQLRFNYANNVPVYATSSIYDGSHNIDMYHDFSGVSFVDMPWILSQEASLKTLRQQARKAWPEAAQSAPRLIALGMDAYLLAESTQRLALLPSFELTGVTGNLYLDQGQIQRQLSSGYFTGGQLREY